MTSVTYEQQAFTEMEVEAFVFFLDLLQKQCAKLGSLFYLRRALGSHQM